MTKIEIVRYRGDTDPIVVKVKKVGGTVDLTGASFILSVSAVAEPVDATYVMQLTGVVDVLTSTVTFTLSEIDADNVGSFYYDVQMISSSTKTILTGKFKMLQDITK